MKTSNDIFNLGFAIINFIDESIIWKSGEFTPKRRDMILKIFKQGYLNFNTKIIN